MNKKDIQENDLIEFLNGKKALVGENTLWIIEQFYDDDLVCSKNCDYNIVRIYRPEYKLIYGEPEITNERIV